MPVTLATLTLLRHAKSSWNDQKLSDHDRPLNNRGHGDAPDMAKRLVERDSIPALILCSSAQRTRDTAAHLLSVFGDPAPDIHYDKSLYLASPDTILAALDQVPDDIKHVMVLAHNPGIEELSAELQGIMTDTMPTAAIRQFTCSSISALRQQLADTTESETDGKTDIKLIYSDYPKNRG